MAANRSVGGVRGSVWSADADGIGSSGEPFVGMIARSQAHSRQRATASSQVGYQVCAVGLSSRSTSTVEPSLAICPARYTAVVVFPTFRFSDTIAICKASLSTVAP